MNNDELFNELMFTGNIVQDSDDSISWPERENRFNRYIELLNSIEGNEGLSIAKALIQSMQAKHDYGAYQSTQTTLGRFPSETYIKALVSELPLMIEKQLEWAGELLSGLANSIDTKGKNDIALFNDTLSGLPKQLRDTICQYIRKQEQAGWLEHRKGILSAKCK